MLFSIAKLAPLLLAASASVLPAELAAAAGRGTVQVTLFQAGSFAAGLAGGLPNIVVGKFDDQLSATGWMYIELATNASYTNLQQAYAAGYAESAVTVPRIWQYFVNSGGLTFADQNLPLSPSYSTAAQILQHLNEPYWHQIALLFAQAQGLADGYNDHAPANQREEDIYSSTTNSPQSVPLSGVPEFAFLFAQLGGDLDDLFWLASDADLAAVDASHSQYSRLRRHAEHRARRAAAASAGVPVPPLTEAGHCSAVVRFVPAADAAAGVPELYSSQVTWSSFEDMTRIYKTYDFPFTTDGLAGSPTVANRFVSFSGYPATVVSGDDWYVLGPTGLVTLETTIGNNNATLYELYMLPQTVLEWARSALANRLSASGAEWSEVFKRLNSGTYNNEWLIIDYERFADGKPGPGTLTVVDQIPGFVATEDVTYMLLQQGYFPSYNIAWNSFIFNMSGNVADVDQFGPWFSYNETARAQIFRRDAPSVTNETALRKLVRYNDFEHDPISRQGCTGNPPFSAENAIAARDDLNPADGNYSIPALGHRDHAAIDAKYTTAALRQSGGGRRLGAFIQAGPTYDSLPTFSFLNTTLDVPHLGLPDVWRMPWVQYES